MWSLALLNHLVTGSRLFSRALSGEPLPAGEELARLRALDRLVDDPAGAHRRAGDELRAAFSQPGVAERTFQVPMGAISGGVMLHLRVTEELVHGWDLARASGQPGAFPEDLAEAELAFSRSQLEARVPRRGRFGEATAAPEDAPAIDRLVAYLGRDLSWSHPGAAERSAAEE